MALGLVPCGGPRPIVKGLTSKTEPELSKISYTCAKAPLGGSSEDDAKVRGMVAAIMGAQMRMGIPHHAHDDPFRAEVP